MQQIRIKYRKTLNSIAKRSKSQWNACEQAPLLIEQPEYFAKYIFAKNYPIAGNESDAYATANARAYVEFSAVTATVCRKYLGNQDETPINTQRKKLLRITCSIAYQKIVEILRLEFYPYIYPANRICVIRIGESLSGRSLKSNLKKIIKKSRRSSNYPIK